MNAVRSNDSIARNFGVIALAQVGGRPGDAAEGDPLEASEEVAKFISKTLSRGKSRTRPWAGVSLGVLGIALKREGRLLPRGAADVLLHMTAETKSAEDATAYAVGAGLIGDNRARDNVLARTEKVGDWNFRAHLAVALGLMGDRRSMGTLVAMMDGAHQAYPVMEQAAIGRALLGDTELVTDLLRRLEEDCDCWSSYYGVSRALAWTGDARAIPPMLAIVRDEGRTALVRSVVIEGLGWIGDRSKLPWHSRISVGLNYTEAPWTLTDPSGFGILDVL